MWARNLYYQLKPFLPRKLQVEIRRVLLKIQRKQCAHIWPIDELAGRKPAYWKGWPSDKKFALILTHDVETKKGHDNCHDLFELESKRGFKSSFNFVPEKYEVSPELRSFLLTNGFEVGVHGLKHDGKLYCSRKIFTERSIRINKYLNDWGSKGFRSPAMHHNLDWIHDLDILYDASTFDTDPFEPQPDGVQTIFPFVVKNNVGNSFYVELPYTLPQDSTLYVFMQEKSIDIWTRKLDWIAENNGMALLITHPDYMNFTGKNMGLTEYPSQLYERFLDYIKSKYEGQYWHVLPHEIATYIINMDKNIEKSK